MLSESYLFSCRQSVSLRHLPTFGKLSKSDKKLTGYEFWVEIVKEVIKYAFITGGGGLLVAWIMRFSKSRQERLSETFKELLGVAELSVDQYLEKLNVITELDKETTVLRGKVRELDAIGMETLRMREDDARKLRELERHREERDGQIAKLQAQVAESQKQISEFNAKQAQDIKETILLREDVAALRTENKAAKNAIRKLLQVLIEREVEPPDLTDELDVLGETVRNLVVKRKK